jgi:hypothetical protein
LSDGEDNEDIRKKSIQMILERDGVVFYRKNSTLNDDYLIELAYDPERDCQFFCDEINSLSQPKGFHLKVLKFFIK